MVNWKVPCKILPHYNGWVIFQFENNEDMDNVLAGGPYFIFGRSLLLRSIPENFCFQDEDYRVVPVWVQLQSLPLQCWNSRAISQIASRLGKPLCVDNNTLERKWISYARVLVEIDTSIKPVDSFDVKLPSGFVYKQYIVFENLPKFCGHCFYFGHYFDQCKHKEQGGQHAKPVYAVKKIKLSGSDKETNPPVNINLYVEIPPILDENGQGSNPSPNIVPNVVDSSTDTIPVEQVQEFKSTLGEPHQVTEAFDNLHSQNLDSNALHGEDTHGTTPEKSLSLDEPESDDDDFQVVHKRKGKNKSSSTAQTTIMTRNASKSKGSFRGQSLMQKGSLGDGGAPKCSSSSNP